MRYRDSIIGQYYDNVYCAGSSSDTSGSESRENRSNTRVNGNGKIEQNI